MNFFKPLLLVAAFASVSCSPNKAIDANPSGLATTSLTGTYWKLTELNGKPVADAGKSRRNEIFMILDKRDGGVEGNGGCNSFGGKFQATGDGFRIAFSQLMATQMACLDMELESGFFKALGMTDSYSIRHNGLQLFKAKMAPLAKFVAVPEKNHVPEEKR